MDTAGDCVGRLGLKGWGMESKGFLGVGTRSWDLWFSVSVGCGRGWATTAHALNSVHSRSTGEGGEQQGARGGQSVFRRFGRGNISPSEKLCHEGVVHTFLSRRSCSDQGLGMMSLLKCTTKDLVQVFLVNHPIMSKAQDTLDVVKEAKQVAHEALHKREAQGLERDGPLEQAAAKNVGGTAREFWGTPLPMLPTNY